MSEPTSTARQPWVAVVLSLFCAGLGQIYCGHIVAGLALFLGGLLFAPAVVLAALCEPSTAVLIGLLLALLGVLGIYLYAVVDAYRRARRSRDPYEPRDYNRRLVYALFILVGVTYPVGVVCFLRANVFEAFYIPTASEVPNFLPGDRILVNKTVYQRRYPRRGDVVVFRTPADRRLTWIKRVIGLPGDTVLIRDNQVFVNGKKLERDRVPAESLSAGQDALDGEVFSESNAGRRYLIMVRASGRGANHPAVRVPEGSCFVLGDNRNHSRDSREFGFIPLGEILGQVQYVYCPAQTWSRFGAYHD
jgi:signal peptidase I